MKLKNVGLKFRDKYKIMNGQTFFGQILDIPDTSRVSNFLSARRYLRVHIGTNVQSSNVAIIENDKYIVGEHGTGFFRNPIYKHFKLFLVDQQRAWIRNYETEDLVTGVKKKSSELNLGVVHISVQPKSDLQDSILVQTPRHTIVCDKEIKVDDKLGEDWVVTKVDPQLGLYVAEVKEG